MEALPLACIHLITYLARITPVRKYGGLVVQQDRHTRRTCETCQPCKALGIGGHIFAHELIATGEEKAVHLACFKFLPDEGLAVGKRDEAHRMVFQTGSDSQWLSKSRYMKTRSSQRPNFLPICGRGVLSLKPAAR